MELTRENEPNAFCDDCGELLPEPYQDEIGQGIYQLVTECPCGAEYRSSL